jgi:hypothetical protein
MEMPTLSTDFVFKLVLGALLQTILLRFVLKFVQLVHQLLDIKATGLVSTLVQLIFGLMQAPDFAYQLAQIIRSD